MSNSLQSTTVDGGNGQDVTRYEFNDHKSLLAVANQPELQASEKPIYALDDGGDLRLSRAHGTGASAHASEVDEYKLVYNEATGTVFNAVTADYEIINPGEFVGPLVSELAERGRTDVTGNVWVRNGGANAYAQILFTDTHNIWLPNRGRSDPVRCGFTLRWSHDGGLSVKAQGFAQDTACSNSIRQVTSGIYVKHAGDVDGRIEWIDEWQTVLDELGTFSETLGTVIEGAMSETMLDFTESDPSDGLWRDVTDPLDTIEAVTLPGPVTENDRDLAYALFELLDYPKYIGVDAVDRLMFRLSQKDDPRTASVWDVYSALTYALTHSMRGTPGASDDSYHRTAKDVLMNPAQVLDDVEREARSRSEPDAQGVALADAVEGDAIEDSTGDALRTHAERSRALAETFDA